MNYKRRWFLIAAQTSTATQFTIASDGLWSASIGNSKRKHPRHPTQASVNSRELSHEVMCVCARREVSQLASRPYGPCRERGRGIVCRIVWGCMYAGGPLRGARWPIPIKLLCLTVNYHVVVQLILHPSATSVQCSRQVDDGSCRYIARLPWATHVSVIH